MDIFETIQRRRTVRKFLDTPVEWEKVGHLLMGAHYAPSAGNIQSWRFLVVTDRAKRKAIAEACLQQYWMEEAAVHIIICSDPHEMERQYDDHGATYDLQSCACAAENMLLLAQDQGLGAAWVGGFEENMLRKAVGIPSKIKPHMVLVFGYADEEPPTPEKYHISDITYVNSYGSKIANLDLVMQDWSKVVQKKFWEAKEATLKKSGKLGTRFMMGMRKHSKKIDEKVQKAKEEMEHKKKLKKVKKEFEKEKKKKRK